MNNKEDYKKEIIEMIERMENSKVLKILHSFIKSFSKEEEAWK